MSTHGFWSTYGGMFTRPGHTFRALVGEPRRVRLALGAVALSAIFYSLAYAMLSACGGYPSSFTPWLAIPAEDYYRYNALLLPPAMFGAWIVSAGVVQLVSRLVGGSGSFEDTLSVLGFAISAATWCTLGHDLVTSGLGVLGFMSCVQHEHDMNAPTFARTLIWTLMLLYVAALGTLFAKGIGVAQRVRGGKAALLAVAGVLVYQFVYMIFNR